MNTVFKGDDKALVRSISALLDLDAKDALAPHGIGQMARDLLEASAARLTEALRAEPAGWQYQAFEGGRWLPGDDRIEGNREKTIAAGFPVRDVFAGPQAQHQQGDDDMPDLHSRPEERGSPETEPCSSCGTPGWTGTCEKCIPY